MRKLSLSLLGAVCLSSLVAAQTGAEPGIVRPMSLSKLFSTSAQKIGTGIIQIAHFRRPIDRGTAGQFTAAVTFQKLVSTYGGDGLNDGVVIGTYNQAKQTVTWTTQANKVTAASAFGLMIEPKIGQVCVVDYSTGPMVATWNATTKAFNAPKAIAGITGTYVDPSVAYIEGATGPVLTLFWVDTINAIQGVYMATLDPNAGKITTTPKLVAKGTTASPSIHSPTPMFGLDYNAHGLLCASRMGSDSDMFFSGDLDPNTGIHKVQDSTSWLNNGGSAGGTLMFADSANYGFGAQELGVAWLLGDEAGINTSATITAAAETKNAGSVTVVFLAASYLNPVAVPGFGGHLGINPAGILPLPPISIPNDGVNMGSFSLPIPNDTTLKGKSVPIQGLHVNLLSTKKLVFTNTAAVSIR